MFQFNVDLNFLKHTCTEYFFLCKCYIENKGNFLVLLSLLLMIITLPLYLAFLVAYGLFLVLNFAQDFYVNFKASFFVALLLLILKILLWIPSICLIAPVYFSAKILGYLIAFLTIPCDMVKRHIEASETEEANNYE